MPVYVDRKKMPYGRMLMCHLLADTLPELHAMADTIGLARRHFQAHTGKVPHYDLSQAYRAKAVKAGAVEIDPHRTALLVRMWRQVGKAAPQ